MRLTTKSQYGFQVLGVLVRNWKDGDNPYLQVCDLAARCDASPKYLEQVLLPLSYAGILDSKRGRNGGYRLNRGPEDISLAEVLRHLEGTLLTIPHWAEDGAADSSRLGLVLRRVRDALRHSLETTSLAVLAQDHDELGAQRAAESGEALMYYI